MSATPSLSSAHSQEHPAHSLLVIMVCFCLVDCCLIVGRYGLSSELSGKIPSHNPEVLMCVCVTVSCMYVCVCLCVSVFTVCVMLCLSIHVGSVLCCVIVVCFKSKD